jgi:calcineurin-like phosphoesterase family protein
MGRIIMIKSLKFHDTEDSKLYVTGCTHLNHDPKWENPIWKMRGYNSSSDMTSGIINKINEICRPTDYLLVLGDFCLNTPPEAFINLIARISPKLQFIRGNHNNSWEKMYYDHCIEKFGYEVVGYEWMNKITYLGDYVNLIWNGKLFIGNHYPYYVFDKMSNSAVSLVSHSHGNCDLTKPTDLRMKQIDCGWDVWAKPISFSEIEACAAKKQIFKVDHH